MTADAGIVIVGAGHAGFAAAASLRKDGYTAPITMLGDEDTAPYQRPPLSKGYLLGKIERRRLAFRPDAFFARQDILVRTGDAAVAIDRPERTVCLASGVRVPFDALILATGAQPRTLPVPGADLERVRTLRTVADVDNLAPHLAAARTLAVVGGGFIGLELAAVAAAMGVKTIVLEAADRLLQRSLSAPSAAHMASAHETWGNEIRRGAVVTAFSPNGSSSLDVHVDGGQIRADVAVIGVGATPSVDLAQSAGLAVDDGVLVDRFLQTSDPAIFAIGDCARFATADGTTRRRESVQNATDHAQTVARTLTGEPTAFHAVPWFWSDQGDIKLQIAGDATGHDSTEIVGSLATGSFSTRCYRTGRLVAVESINDPATHVAARKHFEAAMAASCISATDWCAGSTASGGTAPGRPGAPAPPRSPSASTPWPRPGSS